MVMIPPTQGIYAILVPDQRFSPRGFAVLYFGEAGDISQRLTSQHEKLSAWYREAAGRTLYFAYHVTPGMTDQQRRNAECELINAYLPPCNERVDRPLYSAFRRP